MDWRYNTIWFDQIKDEEKATWHYDKKHRSPLELSDLRYFTTWHYKMNSELPFDALPALNNLLYLELNSSNVTDFRGIEKFITLKRLELHYCLKLQNDVGISALKNSIEILHIQQSKMIEMHEHPNENRSDLFNFPKVKFCTFKDNYSV